MKKTARQEKREAKKDREIREAESRVAAEFAQKWMPYAAAGAAFVVLLVLFLMWRRTQRAVAPEVAEL